MSLLKGLDIDSTVAMLPLRLEAIVKAKGDHMGPALAQGEGGQESLSRGVLSL